MKKLATIGVAGAALAGAVFLANLGTNTINGEQRLLVRFSQDTNDAPLGWIVHKTFTNITDVPDGFDANMSVEEFANHRASRRADYERWKEAKVALAEKPVRDVENAAKDALNAIRKAAKDIKQGKTLTEEEKEELLVDLLHLVIYQYGQ